MTLTSTGRGALPSVGCSARTRASKSASLSGTSSSTKCASSVLEICSRSRGNSQALPRAPPAPPWVLGRPCWSSRSSGRCFKKARGPHAEIAAPSTASASGRASKLRCTRRAATSSTADMSRGSAGGTPPFSRGYRRRRSILARMCKISLRVWV